MTPAELAVQLRRSPVLNQLHLSGEPLTRENYLDLAYMGNPPAELSAEEENQLPEFLQLRYIDNQLLKSMGVAEL